MLFLLKTTSILKNTEIYQSQGINQANGLTVNNATIEDLVNKDADGDGIPDWQEGLYGLDPTKKETTPGIPDSTALNKLRTQQGNNAGTTSGGIASVGAGTENLTQTEKFSRELFATATALNQNGQTDQATIDALGNSLAEKIQNSVQRKVYSVSDIKITDSDAKQAIQKYSDALDSIYLKYRIKKGVTVILQEFATSEGNTDILLQLDPVIDQSNKIISESLKIQVPQSLSLLHLDLINNFQKMEENLSDIKLFDSDAIVAMGAIVQYEKIALDLASSASKLTDTIKQKLNN